jgi:predicted CoA-binding protein
MATIKEAAAEFLASRRIAVTGVSRQPGQHGSNVVYTRLRERGYEVFAVNPNAQQVEGDPAYPDLRSIPGGVDAVVIGTRPEVAEETMRECAELGIGRVWMHRGPGRGSVSQEAAAYGRERRIGHRRRLSLHVRPDRRPGPQDHARAPDAQRQRPQARLTCSAPLPPAAKIPRPDEARSSVRRMPRVRP